MADKRCHSNRCCSKGKEVKIVFSILQLKTMTGGFHKNHLLLIALSLVFFSVFGQPVKKNISLKDSLDAKFDLSDYIIDANGFVPVPYIITEPALGGFGGALFPVFITKRPPYYDSVKGQL